jgi:hypothetical protein
MSWKYADAKTTPEQRHEAAVRALKNGRDRRFESEEGNEFWRCVAAFGSSQDDITYFEACEMLDLRAKRPDGRRRYRDER